MERWTLHYLKKMERTEDKIMETVFYVFSSGCFSIYFISSSYRYSNSLMILGDCSTSLASRMDGLIFSHSCLVMPDQ